MIYLAVTLILLLLQGIFITSSPINIYPELFVYPWLVLKGFIPYKNFFDHHGFFLYYLIAPLSFDKSLFLIKAFYLFIQSLNLYLFLHILKKTSNKISFILCGIIYVLLNTYLSSNNLWFENVIATLYLSIYIFMSDKPKQYSYYIISFLLFLSSIIKPTSAIMLIPTLSILKKRVVLIVFIFLWIMVGLYFYFNQSLNLLISNLFLFNVHYGKEAIKSSFSNIEQDFIHLLWFIGILSVFVAIFVKRTYRISNSLLFFIFSLVFLLNGKTNTSLIPVIPFFLIEISYLISIKQIQKTVSLRNFLYITYLCFLLYFGIFLAKKIKHKYVAVKNTAYIENEDVLNSINDFKKLKIDKKSIYVIGNQIEIYYLLNTVPHTYHLLNFPWISDYYPIEKSIITDLKKSRVEVILMPINPDKNYSRFNLLMKYVQNYYKEKEQTVLYKIFYLNNL